MVIKTIVREFCDFSRQKTNVEKSKLYVLSNTNWVVELAISSKSGIPRTSNLGKYLGFLFMYGRVTKNTYREIGSKVKREFSGWKNKLLSKVAWSLLI